MIEFNIPSAQEMRMTTNEIHDKALTEAVQSVVNAINNANKKGYRHTCFSPSAYWYTNDCGIRTFMRVDDEVKAIFKMRGYTFKPTGYIGGVWQRTEEICW